MNNIFKNLIQKTEIQHKPLGEVCDIADNARKPVKSDQRISGEVPYYGANNIQDYVDGFTHDGEYVLIAEDGSASLQHYSIQFVTGKFWANNHVHVVKGKDGLISRFLFHYLSQFNFQKYLTGGTRAKLTKQQMLNIPIPIPSLEIQQKVVEILDKMTDYVTELTAELTAELTLRQKQYSYYRDQLLTFPSQSDSDESLSVRWLKMGEFGEFIRGNGMQKKDFVESGFPAIHYGQIYTKYGLTADKTFTFVTDELASKLRQADKNDLLIATTSENDEDVCKPLAWMGGKTAISGDMMIFRHSENVKYLAYYFQTAMFQADKKRKITGTKVRRVSSADLSNLTVPIPPLTEQKRIVEILDKFDKLTSDLTDGLPHEIELHQKQYEYWREQLLSFKKE